MSRPASPVREASDEDLLKVRKNTSRANSVPSIQITADDIKVVVSKVCDDQDTAVDIEELKKRAAVEGGEEDEEVLEVVVPEEHSPKGGRLHVSNNTSLKSCLKKSGSMEKTEHLQQQTQTSDLLVKGKGEQDALIAKLTPVPRVVARKAAAPSKKKRSFIARMLRPRGAVPEDDDGLYEQQPPMKDDDASSSASDYCPKTLQKAEGRVRVEVAEEPEGESSFSILIQVMLPFLVAGLGMVGAGLVLDNVQHWDVFISVTELYIMVPALLGLKGNLEMTLASRLSTHANMGHLDKTDECLSMIVGNLALIQCQAIVVGFLASVAAVVMGWIPAGNFSMLHSLLLCAAALVTASFASFILGVIMVAVVLLSRKCRINPDNVATPIAASLGDLTTLGLLAWIASLLYDAKASDMWLAPLIILGYILSLPLWVWLASRNRHTKEVLYSGWTPVISAMMISSMGGVILDFAIESYEGIAVYQPVINGVGGNLVAVQASRISTALHLATPLGRLPRYASRVCHNPGTVFCTNTGHARTARVLLLLVIPGHLVFAYTISYVKAGHTSLTPIFVIVYITAALTQVVILLYVSVVMVHWMWSVCIDPDNSAIPYLTAFGDLIGTGLLAIAFHLLYLVGDKDSDLGD